MTATWWQEGFRKMVRGLAGRPTRSASKKQFFSFLRLPPVTNGNPTGLRSSLSCARLPADTIGRHFSLALFTERAVKASDAHRSRALFSQFVDRRQLTIQIRR
jgi:hypothetical protein